MKTDKYEIPVDHNNSAFLICRPMPIKNSQKNIRMIVFLYYSLLQVHFYTEMNISYLNFKIILITAEQVNTKFVIASYDIPNKFTDIECLSVLVYQIR